MNWNELALKYTQETLEFIKSTKDVAITQGSLYIQELIKLEIALSILNIVASLVLIFIAYLCYKKLKNTEKLEHTPEIMIPVGATFIATLFIGLGFLESNTERLIKATVAPRVLIIEKLTNAVKGK